MMDNKMHNCYHFTLYICNFAGMLYNSPSDALQFDLPYYFQIDHTMNYIIVKHLPPFPPLPNHLTKQSLLFFVLGGITSL